MTAEGFKYKEFAEDLSGQAKAVVPNELSPQDQEYVYNTVKNFCFIAGEALANDKEHTYTVDQASIITQFIGEWSFHKSLDIIRGNVPVQFRDGIMQKIAFTIFEIAKQATFKGLPQDQMIGLVEHHVKKAYNEALEELMKRGALTEQQAQNAANQSNIDEMAKAENEALDNASDLKILKLAAFALIAKKLPNDKMTVLLNKFDKTDANVILQYIQLDDLETKIDPSLLKQCFYRQYDGIHDVLNLVYVLVSGQIQYPQISTVQVQHLVSDCQTKVPHSIVQFVEQQVYFRYSVSYLTDFVL